MPKSVSEHAGVAAADYQSESKCLQSGGLLLGDWLTALLGITSLAVLFALKIASSALIAARAATICHELGR